MTLIDAVGNLDILDAESTIYVAEPWVDSSLAIVAHEPKSGGLPEEAERLGLKYFLEVFLARDFLEDWVVKFEVEPTLQEKCARLIQYATHDA